MTIRSAAKAYGSKARPAGAGRIATAAPTAATVVRGGAKSIVVIPAVVIPVVVENISPAAGTQIGRATPITFGVSSSQAFNALYIKIVFPNLGLSDIVYDQDGFGPAYNNGQCTKTTLAGGGFTFQLVRTGGWLDVVFNLEVTAANGTGGST